jgi:hypothetical protein
MSQSFVSIPVPTPLFLELVTFLKKEGFTHDPVQVVGDAIEYWMENVSWKKDDMYPEVSRSERGYTWKPVFLPHGTKIRMKYKRTMHYAAINGDEFIYQEQSMSPSEFAKHVSGGVPRNAWRDLEIKRPTDEEWTSADFMRTQVKQFLNDMDAISASIEDQPGTKS